MRHVPRLPYAASDERRGFYHCMEKRPKWEGPNYFLRAEEVNFVSDDGEAKESIAEIVLGDVRSAFWGVTRVASAAGNAGDDKGGESEGGDAETTETFAAFGVKRKFGENASSKLAAGADENTAATKKAEMAVGCRTVLDMAEAVGIEQETRLTECSDDETVRARASGRVKEMMFCADATEPISVLDEVFESVELAGAVHEYRDVMGENSDVITVIHDVFKLNKLYMTGCEGAIIYDRTPLDSNDVMETIQFADFKQCDDVRNNESDFAIEHSYDKTITDVATDRDVIAGTVSTGKKEGNDVTMKQLDWAVDRYVRSVVEAAMVELGDEEALGNSDSPACV